MILLLAMAYPATIAVLFYLAFLRPVQQQQKKQREQLLSLHVGDEVVTQAGFLAVIKEVLVPEVPGPTILILDLAGIEVRADASVIIQRLSVEQATQVAATSERQEMREQIPPVP